jgi:tetratricopeptide (TPR) repeat protein
MKTGVGTDRLAKAVIRKQLRRILNSTPFSRSERMRRFLRYTVEQTLHGQLASLKEYSIALNSYDKPATFDPRLDPIIRVEANRLRTKLREYYETEGRFDPVVISLPKKSYQPQFKLAASTAANRRSAYELESESEAYRLYLKGRYYWNNRAPRDLLRAKECFLAALGEKRDFALALAGLGDCHAALAWLEYLHPDSAWLKAKDAATRALQVNPALAQAHATLACERALHAWDWQEAEDGFRKAISLDGAYATAHHWYAMFCLVPQRRLEESLAEMLRARELDPASAMISGHLGRLLYFRRNYRQAAAQLRESIQLDPTFHLAYWHLGFACVQLGELPQAYAAFAEACRLSENPATIAGMGYVSAFSGDIAGAQEAVERLNRFASSRYISRVSYALISTALGDADGAFRYLQQAIEQRASRLVHLKVEPAFDSLKTDPRFLGLLAGLNV